MFWSWLFTVSGPLAMWGIPVGLAVWWIWDEIRDV